MDIPLTLLVAIIGGGLFLYFKIPGSIMVGAMIAVAAFHLSTGQGALPSWFSTMVQYLLGCYIGNMLRRDDLHSLGRLVKPAAILTLTMTCYAICSGLLLGQFLPASQLTAMYASAPGGMVEVCIFAAETEANVSAVAAVHTLRMGTLYLLIPIMATASLKKLQQKSKTPLPAPTPPNTALSQGVRVRRTAATLVVGAVGTIIGRVSGIPAGSLLSAIILTAAFSIITGHSYVPKWLKRVAQIASGACVGMRFSLEDLLQIKGSLLIVFLIILGYLGLTVILGRFMARWGYLDLPTAIFSCCAGGISDITLVASDYDVDLTKVVVLHLVRYFSIFITYPILGVILA